MNREKMIELFKNEYGVDNREIKTFLSPGRVNLIGEHIDYNGGFVFPSINSWDLCSIIIKR